jgi:hypothetical protein
VKRLVHNKRTRPPKNPTLSTRPSSTILEEIIEENASKMPLEREGSRVHDLDDAEDDDQQNKRRRMEPGTYVIKVIPLMTALCRDQSSESHSRIS